MLCTCRMCHSLLPHALASTRALEERQRQPNCPQLHCTCSQPIHSAPPSTQALEERQRQLRATDGAPPPRLTSQHLYNTVNAQMGIIQAQASFAVPAWCRACHL